MPTNKPSLLNQSREPTSTMSTSSRPTEKNSSKMISEYSHQPNAPTAEIASAVSIRIWKSRSKIERFSPRSETVLRSSRLKLALKCT